MVVDLRQVGKLLSPAVFSLGLFSLVPAGYAIVTATAGWPQFTLSAAISVAVSLLLRRWGKGAGRHAGIRELFLFTASLWVLMTLIAAVPLYLTLSDLDFSAALFESASGFSTTGATAITGLEFCPPAVLLWRSILQFLGGVGFVVIAVAILPNVAMGGMNIFKTESTSFDDTAKFTPHLKTMAVALLIWYLVTAVLCTGGYLLGGFPPFLAVNTAMCTVATGGMMPLDRAMNDAPALIQYTAIVFMYLGSLPFMLLLGALSGGPGVLRRDQQVRGFTLCCLIVAAAVAASLVCVNGYAPERAIRVSLFNAVSILSTTGFGLEDFTAWNSFATMIFLIILAIGGCSGSTSGGIKFFRLQICYSLFRAQTLKTLHPHAVSEPRFKGRIIDSATLRSVIMFLVAYLLTAMVSAIIAATLGLCLSDAVTGSLSALSNIGPAIGPVLGPSHSFAALSAPLHLLFAADMILGRLEILPVLLCLSRRFWRW